MYLHGLIYVHDLIYFPDAVDIHDHILLYMATFVFDPNISASFIFLFQLISLALFISRTPLIGLFHN